MSKRKMSLLSSFENISPQVISRVGREIQDLQRDPPDGIRFLPQEEDTIAEIHAEIKGPVGTPYDGGSFHIKLVLSNDFPHSPPRGFFLTKIYHPNVAPNGDICVNTLKRDWTSEVTLTHVLQVIRCLLIVPFPESSLNDEAGRMFMESYTEYERRVKVWVTIHASKSLSGEEPTCGSTSGTSTSGSNSSSSSNSNSSNSSSNSSSSNGGAGGTVKGGSTVKGTSTGEASVGTNGVAVVVVTDGPKKKASTPVKGSARAGAGGNKGISVGAGGGEGSGAPTTTGGGGGGAGGKRREDAPRKTVKDRQKEAKKKGLKRL